MSLHDANVTMREMRDHAREAVEFTRGRSRQDLDTDRLLQLALVRLVEVIGEAATRLSEEVRRSHPQVPWRLIIGTRNRLIHGYDKVNLNIVWTIVQDNLPTLIADLNDILGDVE